MLCCYYCRGIIVRLGEQWETDGATTHCGSEIQLLDFLWRCVVLNHV